MGHYCKILPITQILSELVILVLFIKRLSQTQGTFPHTFKKNSPLSLRHAI